jgi:aminopeptidase-like protein
MRKSQELHDKKLVFLLAPETISSISKQNRNSKKLKNVFQRTFFFLGSSHHDRE